MSVNLDWYKTFYYVAKRKSITLASEDLFISQPAVSQTIRLLESALDCPLFVRTPKGVIMTPEGEVLFHYISNGYEQILSGERKLAEMQNLESGEIRVGASDMTLGFYLLPFLEEFHKLFPKIKIQVTNGSTPETILLLKDGKIDFGIVSEPIETDPDYTLQRVKNIQDVFIAGMQFADLKNRKLKLSELAKLPVICLEKNTSTRKYVDGFLRQNNVVIQPEFELATSDLIVQFTARNLGIGSVMKNFAEKELANGKVFELEFVKKIPERNICLLRGVKTPISKAGSKLLEILSP